MANPTDVYGPQRRYAEKQEAKGLIKISAWVPEDQRDKALDYIAQLRAKATK